MIPWFPSTVCVLLIFIWFYRLTVWIVLTDDDKPAYWWMVYTLLNGLLLHHIVYHRLLADFTDFYREVPFLFLRFTTCENCKLKYSNCLHM